MRSAAQGPAPARTATAARLVVLAGAVGAALVTAAGPRAFAAPPVPPPEEEKKVVSPELEALIGKKEAEVYATRTEAIGLLEAFLRESKDPDETAEALYKLAELTWEDARVEYLAAMGRYQAQVASCHQDRARCREVPRHTPAMDLKRPQGLYLRLIKEHPGFRKMDTVLYLYAFSLRDQGAQGKAIPYFQRIIDEFPKSRYVADAWMSVAEQRFYEEQNVPGALEAYEQVIRHPASQLYDLALFKTAWCYWKMGDTTRSAERFKDVLDLAKKRKGRSSAAAKRAVELEGQALEYLVELFTEDESKSAQDAFTFLAQIGGKEYSTLVLRRLADTVFDQTRYERATEAYRLLISLDAQSPDAPDWQRRISECQQLLGDTKLAVAEMRKLATDYGPQSEWARANRTRPNAVAHARQIAEELARNTAKGMHAEAQRNEKESRFVDKDRYARAAEAYEFYLGQFADAPDAVELRYFRADILYFKLADYSAAGNEYLAVGRLQPPGKYHKEALLQAMTSFEKLRKATAAAGGKRQVTDDDRKFAEAADLYAQIFPNDKEIVTVIYKNGQFFYDLGDYDEAAKRFGLIVEKYPDDPNAASAGDRILETLNKAKDYENIETWARRLKKAKPFAAKAEQERLDRLIVESVMKSGDKYAEAGDYDKAAGFWRRVPAEYPRHAAAPKALNNVGAAMEKAKKQDQAVAAFEELARMYPAAPEAPEGLFTAARIEETVAAYDRAADLYERFCAAYPQHKSAPDALRSAGVLRQSLSQYDKAVKHFQEYGRKYKSRPDAKDVAFQAAVLEENRKDWKGAAAAFGEYAKAFPGDVRALEALVREAAAQLEAGNEGRAKEALGKALSAYGGRRKEPEAAYHLGHARFLQGTLVERDFDKLKLAGKPRQLQKVLEEKAKLLEQARTVFLDAVGYGAPEWATAALEGIGQGYEGFARAMRNAPVPKDLTPEEQQLYRDELEKVVVVIEDKAVDAYRTGYAKAIEIGVYNKHTQQMRAALARLDQGSFPPEAEMRMGPRLGEARASIELIEEVRRDR